MLNWTPEAEQLRLRLHCAAQWLPEEAWPAVDDASLLASLEAWLLPQMNGVHSLRALKALDLRQGATGLAAMAAAPEAGSRAADALYRADRQPPGDPIPCGEPASAGGAYAGDVRRGHDAGDRRGRVPLVLELLSPAQRPLQITRDLSAFWQGATARCRKR